MYWPAPATVALLCLIFGAKKGVWQVPLAVVAGYAATRLCVEFLPPVTHEVGICLIWLCVAISLYLLDDPVPAVLFALSGLAYPAVLLGGIVATTWGLTSLPLSTFKVTWLGIGPIIAEIFAALALLIIGGGIGGLYFNSDSSDRAGHPSGPIASESHLPQSNYTRD